MSKILVHSNLGALIRDRLPQRGNSHDFRNRCLEAAFNRLSELSNDREILLPAFNYKFTSTRIFNPEEDLPEVGKIPEHAMIELRWARSVTPVFSFLSNLTTPSHFLRPFSGESVFAEVASHGGDIMLVGVGFDKFTFIHHVEDLSGIPYRYPKLFSGQLVEKEQVGPISVEFHVRPLGFDLHYNFEKIEQHLLKSKAASKGDPGIIVISATDALDTLREQIEKDPLWLLDDSTRIRAAKILDTLGRPFQIFDFEKPTAVV